MDTKRTTTIPLTKIYFRSNNNLTKQPLFFLIHNVYHIVNHSSKYPFTKLSIFSSLCFAHLEHTFERPTKPKKKGRIRGF